MQRHFHRSNNQPRQERGNHQHQQQQQQAQQQAQQQEQQEQKQQQLAYLQYDEDTNTLTLEERRSLLWHQIDKHSSEIDTENIVNIINKHGTEEFTNNIRHDESYFHLCVRYKHYKLLHKFMQYKWFLNDIDLKNKFGRTALSIAVIIGNIRMTRLLFSMGGDIFCKDNDGRTPKELIFDNPAMLKTVKILEKMQIEGGYGAKQPRARSAGGDAKSDNDDDDKLDLPPKRGTKRWQRSMACTARFQGENYTLYALGKLIKNHYKAPQDAPYRYKVFNKTSNDRIVAAIGTDDDNGDLLCNICGAIYYSEGGFDGHHEKRHFPWVFYDDGKTPILNNNNNNNDNGDDDIDI